MNTWNPDLYMQFGSERTRPSIDLVSRIKTVNPKNIIDIGCGPGNSTQVLINRWPNAAITGLDNSQEMIKKAKCDHPAQEWIHADITTFEAEIKYDILFSNAVIQWIPNHESLMKKFHDMLCDDGLIAVQIPLFWDMPLGSIVKETSKNHIWNKKLGEISDFFTFHNYSFYYDELSLLFNKVEMWRTDYFHIFKNHLKILNMMKSAGLRPYLNRLESDDEKNIFENEILEKIETKYSKQKNGNIILPFKRLFFIGYKSD